MLLPWWKNQNLLNPEEIWRLKIASMVIALGWNRREHRCENSLNMLSYSSHDKNISLVLDYDDKGRFWRLVNEPVELRIGLYCQQKTE